MRSLIRTSSFRPGGMGSVAVNSQGIAYMHLLPDGDNHAVSHCDFLPCANSQKQIRVLKKYVSSQGLKDSNCVYVLQPNDYRLILIDKPNVPESELGQAAKWAVMDFIDFPVAEATIDFFDLPVSMNQKEKLYVVVVRTEILQRAQKLIGDAGLNLCRIDIADLALCNVISKLEESKNGIAFLFSSGVNKHILISKDGQVYFERKIEKVLHAEKSLKTREFEEKKENSNQSSLQADLVDENLDADEYLMVDVQDNKDDLAETLAFQNAKEQELAQKLAKEDTRGDSI